jgi:hypothetical protein
VPVVVHPTQSLTSRVTEIDDHDPPERVTGTAHLVDDRETYAEYVAMLAEDQEAAEQAARAERAPATETSGSTPTMDELGLDPRSERDCDVYASYLESEAERQMIRDDAERAEAEGDVSVFGDTWLLTLLAPASSKEQREFALLVLREQDRDRRDFSRRAPLALARSPSRVGARRREHRARTSRRVRTRSGSRGDPPDDPDQPPGVELEPAVGGRLGVKEAA